MSAAAVPHPMGFQGLFAPATNGVWRDRATHIPLVVETFDHALIPAYEATKRIWDAREPGESRSKLVKKALRASAFPLALGATLVGANLFITKRFDTRSDGIPIWNTAISDKVGVSYGHVLDLSCGAILGFISGAVETLKPEWVGHHRHGHRLHGSREDEDHAFEPQDAFETRGQKMKRALKNGVTHTGAHVIDDIKLLTVMRLFFGV